MGKATVNHDIRKKLMERFRSLTGNRDIKELNSLKKDIEAYLKNYEDDADQKIENTLYLIKAWINYRLTDDLKSSYALVSPLLENLKFDNLKSNYNKMLLIGSIVVCKDYKQALEIVLRLGESVSKPSINESIKIAVNIHAYSNFTEILLNTKFFSELSTEEEDEVDSLFSEYCEKAKNLCVSEEYLGLCHVTELKEGIFYKDKKLQDRAMKLANEHAEDEILKAVEDDLDKYKVVGAIINTQAFNKKIGNRIRSERKLRKISTADFAKMIGLSVGALSVLERGERSTTPEKLLHMAQIFGITVHELMHEKYEIINEMTPILNPRLSEVIYLWEELSEAEEDFILNNVKSLISMKNNS